jgi:hypothetical protein
MVLDLEILIALKSYYIYKFKRFILEEKRINLNS